MRYADICDNAYQVLDLTSLTVDEFAQLVGPFETTFVRHMEAWTMEGLPRTGRRYTPYKNSPLPTAHDRLFFILSYLKLGTIQTGHGAAFGMAQPAANQWIHVLLPVLQQTLDTLGDLPARALTALRERLATTVTPAATTPPLFITTAPNGPFRAPTTRMTRKRSTAARNTGIRSITSS